ncbi:heme oxygenase [Nitrincola sp. A-D6]|uniref:biliverdin-producing heme oxygenase n=1 Tax=Nitrincola sp. A-D6 TaxID=1545442 RepID=UPI00051F893C|nr:biliverdin-producing heme oxygenase [Nitrincola sp. A-D6]KGK41168.1 heme oxygenase [Nitrincola sp. A-D6]
MTQTTESEALSMYLKEGTKAIHDQLDHSIMQLNPFADTASYQGFLRMQLRLHSASEAVYQDKQINNLISGAHQRSRLNAVLQDCKDLNISTDLLQIDHKKGQEVSINGVYAGLGWLYTIEGSNLGAAILLKHVKNSLGFSETFGARHMTAHADGRAAHWREFRALLDNLMLTDPQKKQALDAAKQAFHFVTKSVDQIMSINIKEVAG